MLQVPGPDQRHIDVPPSQRQQGGRRFGAGVALTLALSLLVLSAACRSDGDADTEPPPTPAVRATPAPSDEEMAAQVHETAVSLRGAVTALLNDLQTGANVQQSQERVEGVCREAATAFRDANVEGVNEIRDLCREINTRIDQRDEQFWREVRAELDTLVAEYSDPK